MHTGSRTFSLRTLLNGVAGVCAGIHASIFAYVGYWFSHGVPVGDN